MRSVRPDLVHTTLFEADIAGRIAASATGIPVVSSLVNVQYGPEQFGTPDMSPWRLKGAWALDRVTAKRVVRWHAITEHVGDVMSARLHIPRDRIDVVPRGRDPQVLGDRDAMRRSSTRISLGAGAQDRVVLVLARQEHQKGLDVLLDSWPQVLAQVPSARLWLAGRDGDATPGLQATASVLGPRARIEFLGPRKDAAELLCAADAFVLPSRWEGLGSVLLEAMALESPIVASALPAIEEVLQHERSALLVPREHPAKLAAALVRTLRSPAEARTRAMSARTDFLSRYTVEVTAAQMVAFYERALSSARSSVAA